MARKTRRRKSNDILEVVHETAKDLLECGAIDQVTMRHFDRLCLPPVAPMRPAEIKRLREKSKASQAVFARLLNTRVSTVQNWEIGQKRPVGTALKLLHLVKKHSLEIVDVS